MPQVGLGTYLLTPDDAQSSVAYALDNGYELIDTANVYVNERAVGRGMRDSSRTREQIFLETKLWPCFYDSDTAVDETLERLGCDYIDLMILHQPAGNYVAGYAKLEAAYKAGKLRGFDISMLPSVLTALGVCGARFFWVLVVFPASPTFATAMLAYPVSLGLTALLITGALLYCKPGWESAQPA